MMMGSLIPPSLSLDLRPTFVPKTITDLLYDVSSIDNAHDKLLRLDDFVTRLEEESSKIDAFRRELPLSLLLLNDAILVLKEESAKFRTPNSQPVLEEFMTLKKECDQKEENEKENECSDKKNWMSSVQLWNSTVYPNAPEQKQHYQLDIKKSEEEEEKQQQAVGEDPFQSYRNINGSGIFMPFTAYSAAVPAVPTLVTKEEKEEYDINGLSLQTPGFTNLKEGSNNSNGSRISSGKPDSSSPGSDQPTLRTGHANRKQRRCWSPELHRRFVNALHQLGGSQAATPKQIRELMQVDGLTNDEVKSHLQKYRLHTRRTPASSAGTAPGNQTFPFLGGSWLSRDQYNDFTKSSISGYGSPQGPLQLAAGSRGGSTRTEDDTIEDDEVAKSREL